MLCAGHHEAEFGMSWCAGFNGDFWRGYHSILPKEPGGLQSLYSAPTPMCLAACAMLCYAQCPVVGELSSAVCGSLAPGACAGGA